jgi:hypothetical protein
MKQPLRGMTPADRALDAHGLAGPHVDLRLIEKEKLVGIERVL